MRCTDRSPFEDDDRFLGLPEFKRTHYPDFASLAAHFLAELNAIHPFREGNGRTQLTFLALLTDRAGHPLDFDKLDRDATMQAMIASFSGDEAPLAELLQGLAS